MGGGWVTPGGTVSLWHFAGGLLLVLSLIAVLAWLGRRIPLGQGARAGGLRIVTGISVGHRERLVVVEVGRQQLLVSVAPGNVRALHVLPEPIEGGRTPALPGLSFAQLLKTVPGRARSPERTDDPR